MNLNEFDSLSLSNELSKIICEIYDYKEEDGFQKIVEQFIDYFKEGLNEFKLELIKENTFELIKKLNLDNFSISCGIPETETGFAIVTKIPGLSDLLAD